jgi:hypothetical protein
MATWKKVIVSGSAAELLNITASAASITTLNVTAGSGSFSGSFQGDGSGLTNVPATGIVLATLSEGLGIENFSYNGQTNATVTLDTGSAHFEEGVRKQISVADTTGAAGIDLSYDQTTGTISGSLVNSSITLGATIVDLGATATTVDSLTLTNVIATGSFSGSFVGTTNLPDLTAGTGISTFTYDGGATATVAVSGAAQLSNNTVTKWDSGAGKFVNSTLTDNGTNATFSQNVIIDGDLTVQGTASFQNTENLLVKDRFILLASGSNTAGDGGIVVQQGTQNIGEAFAFDSAATRWGVTGSFLASDSAYTPDAFMAAVVVGTGTDPNAAPARYSVAGNIFVSTDESIYIYS